MEIFDPEGLLERRRDALLKTLRRTDAEEVRRFIDDIFTNRQSHPWFKASHDFLDEHARGTFLMGEVGDGMTVVYAAHPADAGLWCKRGETLEAVGLLHGQGLERFRQVAADFLANPS